ncbi:hypothetical protein D3C81_908720 [compost metagenome]
MLIYLAGAFLALGAYAVGRFDRKRETRKVQSEKARADIEWFEKHVGVDITLGTGDET